MRKLFVLMCMVASSLAASLAHAKDINIVGGLRYDSAKSQTVGTDTEGRIGFQGGGIAHFDLSEHFFVRSGMLFTVRRFEVSRGATIQSKPSWYYFEVPVGLLYRHNELFGAFAGLNLGVHVGTTCSIGTCPDAKLLPTGFQVGGTLQATEHIGLEAYYEQGFVELASEVDTPRAVAVQVLFNFL
jgi:hypothetical protein